MLKPAATGLLRPVGCLLIGLLLYHFVGHHVAFAGYVVIFLFLLFLALWVLALKKPLARRRRWAGVAGLLAVAALAFWVSFLRNKPETLPISPESVAFYKLTIVEAVAVKATSVSTVGRLVAVTDSSGGWQRASGKVALFFPRSLEADTLQYGDQLLVKGPITPPPAPANPFQFDYRQFLLRKHIQWQVYVTPENWVPAGKAPPSAVWALSYLVRDKLEEAVVQYLPQKRELAIAQALVLGVKDDLDLALRATYARTGTMHVLAVSGLHVGTFYLLLVWLLKPFRRRKGGRWPVGLTIIAILWFYAFLTGLAPSVLRSVIMFTVVEGGFMFKRRPSILSSLGVAAFFILLLEPNLLFDVGFQLSFIAVAGIVLLQPFLAKAWRPENKVSKFFWNLLTVSVAAQLATFPLGLYYFHQFPVYFGLTNLFAIPLVTVALYLGIAFMVFSPIPLLAEKLGQLLQGVLWFLNEGLQIVAHWPRAVLDGFVITTGQTLALYLLLGAGFLFVLRKQMAWLALVVLCVAFLSGTELAEANRQRRTKELAIYSIRRSSAVSVLNGRQATFFSADSAFYAQPQNFTYNVQPHWWARGVQDTLSLTPVSGKASLKQPVPFHHFGAGNKLLVWKGKRLLWLREMPRKLKSSVAIDALVLQHNVWAPADKIRASFRTGTIILDQTNSRGYLQRKANELRAAGYTVHVLETDGAWIIRK